MQTLQPAASRGLKVSLMLKALHRLAIALAGRNPAKGKLPAAFQPGWHYDADLAHALVDRGEISTTSLSINPATYAGAQWGVSVADGVLSQAEGSPGDLIWVLTMPAARAIKPVLFFHDPQEEGPKILDGSHRLIRAVVDGKTSLNVRVIGPQDAHRFLRCSERGS
jgi:hypothetical protein